MSVTIKDIAKIANVSHTTVSRALNDSPFIKQETKDTIKEIAKQLNYFPNLNARSLVLNKSYNIALVFTSISDGTAPSFFHDVIEGVNSVIKKDYNLVVTGIDEYQDFNSINKKRFDGIILISQSDKDNIFIYDVLKKKIPIVVLNREIQESSIVNLLSADKEGSFKAVSYLIENGHRNIAIIEGKKSYRSSINRKEGFLKALIQNKIQIHDEYMMSGEYSIESGYREMKKLLSLSKLPTAVFCSNDDMAVGAMKAIFEAKMNVPDDISIIGFDDSLVCRYVTPELTSVRKPTKEFSVKGADILLKIIEGQDIKGQRVYINTDLVIRNSVKKLN
jgi:LacI family transcriptional regulator, purine nucleotide synthesis repressor